MKKNIIVQFLMIFSIILFFNSCHETNRLFKKTQINPLKILTYNIRNAKGMDNVTDYDRVVNVIKRINADCVALQELDSATERSHGVVVLNELAKQTGMYASYNKSIPYQGGGYGIGILTKEKPLRTEALPLPGSEERRSILVVEMENYVICCVHWSLTRADRLASVDQINSLVKKYARKPVFLAGDFNTVPSSEEMQQLKGNWDILTDITQTTFPSNNPLQCIDYILNLKNSRYPVYVIDTKAENEPIASDHLPVWSLVKF